MEFQNQKSAMFELRHLASADCHSILLHGVAGCGKSWLSKKYQAFINATDFIQLDAKMQDIKDFISTVNLYDTKSVVCIENIDCGVDGVSQAILKLLEEPPENIYLIVTARYAKNVPNTILSRVSTVFIPRFKFDDLMLYAKEKHGMKAESMKEDLSIFCKNPNDVDFIMSLSPSDLDYLKNLSDHINSKNPVATTVWKIQSLPSGTKIPIDFIIRSLYYGIGERFKPIVLQYESDIDSGVPNHVILSAMILNIKSRVL